MGSILEGFVKAFSLIIQLDRELLSIILLSLEISGVALLIASCLGIPAGSILGLTKFRGRGLAITLSNTFMACLPLSSDCSFICYFHGGDLWDLWLCCTPPMQ